MRTIGPACTLGEGPLWHPERSQLFWFDIPKGLLYLHDPAGEEDHVLCCDFGEPASAAGWVDHNSLIVATASGLQHFSIGDKSWYQLVDLEADNPVTRSNDGRIGPDGSFWIGTMGRKLEPHAGAYYRCTNGKLVKLFDQVSVPNATCFSPDGKFAYLADTFRKLIWRWALDASGSPVENKKVHIDLRQEGLNPDGAVCDAEGYLWNAQWGSSRIARYAPDGTFDMAIHLPASQLTCPAFGGPDLKTLYVTSARENLSKQALENEPEAGKTFFLEVDIPGLNEFRAIIHGSVGSKN